MRILIATGIFPPEIGGPATFASEMAKRLSAAGHETAVITYANEAENDAAQTYPVYRVIRGASKLKNYWNYFRRLMTLAPRFDFIYTLDWFSGGVPVFLACKLRRKPYLVRVGGGYLWEKYLAQGEPPVTLKEFYARGLHRRYRTMFFLIRLVLKNARTVIFNSEQQRRLYVKYYGLPEGSVTTIYNAAPPVDFKRSLPDKKEFKEIVFAGRFTRMKNVTTLIDAFAKVADKTFKLVLIGEGPSESEIRQRVRDLGLSDRVTFSSPLSGTALWERISGAYLVVIPSWTEVSPHQAYECLALGIPVLVTRENFLPFGEMLPGIDPASSDDIAAKLNDLAKPENYKLFCEQLRKIAVNRSWEQVMEEHMRIFPH